MRMFNRLAFELLLLFLLLWWQSATTCANFTDNRVTRRLNQLDGEVCHDQMNAKTRSVFKITSCVYCMKYSYPAALRHLNYSSVRTNLDASTINATCVKMKNEPRFDTDLCTQRILDCCTAAMDCCDLQINARKNALNDNSSAVPYCPITWDGLLCFNASQNGTLVQGVCPSYLPKMSDKKFALKMCLSSGEWERKKNNDNFTWEFTDYRTCFDKRTAQAYLLFERLRLALCCISLAFLVPSIFTFIMLSNLRNQQRIRIHIHLFVALSLETLFAIISILLHTIPAYLVFIENKMEVATCYNSISIVHRYLQTTVFSWIFIEGLYLYRLLTNAFNKDKSLWPYYIIGWVGALIVIGIYVALRMTQEATIQQCWANSEGRLDWITNGPSLLCIVLNLIFFANILRILLMQLQSHPNEPSNYRRALKATFILVPLFGLQWLLTMYQMDYNPDDKVANYVFFYRTVQCISKGSHGLAVALVFCVLNNEVQAEISNCLLRHGIRLFRPRDSRRFSNRSSTNFTYRSGKQNYFSESERKSLTQQSTITLQTRDIKSSASKPVELETIIGADCGTNGSVEAADFNVCFDNDKST